MTRLCLAALLFAVVAGLAGCPSSYTTPKPTQPVPPASVTWGVDQQMSQEQESE